MASDTYSTVQRVSVSMSVLYDYILYSSVLAVILPCIRIMFVPYIYEPRSTV